MLGRIKNCFYFSSQSYFDLISNNIVDTNNGIPAKYTPLSGAECSVLKILINNYPHSVPKEQLCTAISAACNEAEVRRVIDRLRKHHPQLNIWIPRARQGEYRLLEPAAPARPKASRTNSVPHVSCILKNTGICVRPHFVHAAREDVFCQLDDAFLDNHVVFLHGIGGIGKSEIAKHWALQKKREGIFDTVVFAQLNTDTNSSNVLSLITNDTVFVIGGEFRCRDDEETIEAYFQRKLAKIKQITDERTLIIIDNYDIDDQMMALLFTGTYLLLVTTRNKPGGYDFPIISVPEIQEVHHLKQIFFNNLDGDREDIQTDDPYIEKLFSLVSNHTLAIEIIAKSLVNSTDTPESLYQKINIPAHHSLIQNVDGVVERNFLDEPQSAFDCIRLLFSLSRLENDSDYEYKSQVLAFMAAMPTRGIELSLFNKWSNNKIIRAKNSLVQKSWLRQDTVKGVTFVSMHPLIREVIWNGLEPTLKKCSSIIDRFTQDKNGDIEFLYHQPKSTKDQYESVALSLLSAFPIHNLSSFDFYIKIQSILCACANVEIAFRLSNKLKNILEQEKQSETWRYAFVIYRIGAVYSTQYLEREDGIAFYLNAEKQMRSTSKTNDEKTVLAILYREMAVASLRNRYLNNDSNQISAEIIEDWLNKGNTIASNLLNSGLSNRHLNLYFGLTCVWYSRLEVYRGNLDLAVKLIDTAESEFVRYGYINAMDRTAVEDTRAMIHAAKGEYDLEIKCLTDSSQIYIDGFGKYNRSSIERAIKLAIAYQNNGQPAEAIQILTHYQKIAREMLGDDAKLTVIIRNQLELLQ